MARHPEFKAPQGVHVKMPEPSGLFDEETGVVSPEKNGVEWLDIPIDWAVANPVYPYNGEPVWLTPDGDIEYAGVWRTSREFKDGRFQPTGFWAVYNGGGVRINFEPIGYRRYEAPIFIPKKRV